MADERQHARKGRPCPVCGAVSRCNWMPDGLHLCRFADGPRIGWRYLGRATGDPAWCLFRAADDPTPPSGKAQGATQPRAFSSRSLNPVRPAVDWALRVEHYRASLTPERGQALADALGLPFESLAAMPGVGWDWATGCWTFPEIGPDGQISAVYCRRPDGWRFVLKGGKRGLYLPIGWRELPGPVRIVEGASDTLALAWLGLPVVGRFSARGGAEQLALLLRDHDRPLRVLTENDEKADGSCPGREGAVCIAERLAALLPGRDVKVRACPAGYKDVREWVADYLRRR